MRRNLSLIWLLLAATAHADGIISTYIGAPVVNNVLASATVIGTLYGMVIDGVGNVYVSDGSNNLIRRIDGTTGIITTIAGNGGVGYSGDYGPALNATLNAPRGLALYEPSGFATNSYLFVADQGNQRIRRVNLGNGNIDTVAGNGLIGYSGDGGPAIYASLNYPVGVGISGGNVLYISDSGNQRIRYVNLAPTVTTVAGFTVNSNYITTVAGTGVAGYAGDGVTYTPIVISVPSGCAFGPSGDFYFADSGNLRVRRLDTANNITTVAGCGLSGATVNGVAALSAKFKSSSSVFVDASENIFLTDPLAFKTFEVSFASQTVTVMAGNGFHGYSGDGGPATAAELGAVNLAVSDPSGDLFIGDGNHCIREIAAGSISITTYAGRGLQDGVDANLVQLEQPFGIAQMGSGDLLVADSGINQVKEVDIETHLITTFAGIGVTFTSGDGGPATAAGVPGPTSMAIGPNGTVYISEPGYAVIRSVDTFGNISTFAGTSILGYTGTGGQASLARLDYAKSLCVSGGSLYFTEQNSDDIRSINLSTGVITLFAGTPLSAGFMDGPVLSAKFKSPENIVADSFGNFYVSDSGNNALRMIKMGVSPTVSTLCGLGPTGAGYKGDGAPAIQAALNYPVGLALDSSNNIFIGDAGNERVRRIDAGTGIIDTVAGIGLVGYSGDGAAATKAKLNYPSGIAVDQQGNLSIADFGNHVVRQVSYAQAAQPTPVAAPAGGSLAYPDPANDAICFSYVAPQSGAVTIQVYNTAFQLVATFKDNVLAGQALTCSTVRNFAPGVYIYRVQAPGASFAPNKFKVVH